MSTRMVGALVMTHSDDDGLVIPPRLAPKHLVILPIYRNDEERRQVLEYCVALQHAVTARQYAGEPVRVLVDDRDLRGGEKTWQHIKRGVPLRAEIGPRDVAAQSVFVGRRDRPAKDRTSVPRQQFVDGVAELLESMQNGLYQRADQLRQEHTHDIDSLEEFRQFFTPRNKERPEMHGGFARCHWVDDPLVEKVLQELKVTIRCIPFSEEEEPGQCIFTGRPSPQRVILANAY
jgi:prolyl-tRNA synthetase